MQWFIKSLHMFSIHGRNGTHFWRMSPVLGIVLHSCIHFSISVNSNLLWKAFIDEMLEKILFKLSAENELQFAFSNSLQRSTWSTRSSHTSCQEPAQFPPKVRSEAMISPDTTLINIVPEGSASSKKEEKEKETWGTEFVKEEIELFLFADCMIVYVENPKELTKRKISWD